MFCSNSHTCSDMDSTSVSTIWCMYKEYIVYVHNGVLLSCKTEILSFMQKDGMKNEKNVNGSKPTERQLIPVPFYLWKLRKMSI